jgi:hypothetical protein
VIDEMYFTKLRLCRAGVVGDITEPQKTLVLGCIEFDVDRKCLTGRGLLRVIPNAGAAILKQIITTCIVPGDDDGTPVWGDEWPGYLWLDEEGTGYTRIGVCHRDGVFADALGRGGNAAECIWSLVRGDCRRRNMKFPRKPTPGSHGAHAAYFGEFLFRLRNLGTPSQLPPKHMITASFW